MQASAPPVELALSRAGVTGVQKAIRIRRGDAETVMAADIECTVDLARGQKGVHMSRFPEVFDEAIGDAVLGEARIVEEIAEVIARHIVERQNAASRRGADHRPLADAARDAGDRPADAGDGLADRDRRGDASTAPGASSASRRPASTPARARRVSSPAGPRSASPRPASRRTTIEQILELVPIATHNQRGRGTLLVGTTSDIDAETLVDLVERSMSAPVFELLKRPDELFVVEHAHLQPRFVEDSVRVALKSLLDEVPGLADDDFVLSRQVNLETIHDHDVLAERWGTVGELRSEIARRRRRRVRRRSLTGLRRRRRARRAREKRDSVPWSSRPMFCRWSRITATAAAAAKTTVGHGSPSSDAQDRQRHRRHERGERRVAEEDERHDPDEQADARRAAARARARRRRPSRPSCRPS